MITVIKNQDTTELEKLVFSGPNGEPVPIPASVANSFGKEYLQLFGHRHGFYQIITTELVDFLRPFVRPGKTIEIGCGWGVLGRALGIPTTDSRLQEVKEVREYYKATGQPIIAYPEYVEKLDADEAVKKYAPEVVISCWVTQYSENIGEGNVWGVMERKLLSAVDTYIMVGNETIHGKKAIMSIDHQTIKGDWLVSRSAVPEKNVIYIWEK